MNPLAALHPLRRSQRQRKQVDYTYNDYNETILDAVRPAWPCTISPTCISLCAGMCYRRHTLKGEAAAKAAACRSAKPVCTVGTQGSSARYAETCLHLAYVLCFRCGGPGSRRSPSPPGRWTPRTGRARRSWWRRACAGAAPTAMPAWRSGRVVDSQVPRLGSCTSKLTGVPAFLRSVCTRTNSGRHRNVSQNAMPLPEHMAVHLLLQPSSEPSAGCQTSA